jgi:hypothetical protein
MSEDEIDQIIGQIEKEWHSNGYFGDVRDDHALVYEVVARVLQARLPLCKPSTIKQT